MGGDWTTGRFRTEAGGLRSIRLEPELKLEPFLWTGWSRKPFMLKTREEKEEFCLVGPSSVLVLFTEGSSLRGNSAPLLSGSTPRPVTKIGNEWDRDDPLGEG